MILATGNYEENKKLKEIADRLDPVFLAGNESLDPLDREHVTGIFISILNNFR